MECFSRQACTLQRDGQYSQGEHTPRHQSREEERESQENFNQMSLSEVDWGSLTAIRTYRMTLLICRVGAVDRGRLLLSRYSMPLYSPQPGISLDTDLLVAAMT